MKTNYIYHIFEGSPDLGTLQQNEEYAPAGWEAEGFIHCCTESQILPTLHKWFEGKTQVQAMRLKVAELKSEVKFEDLYNHGAEFPHIYGVINTSAAESIIEFKRNEKGDFQQTEQ